MISHQPTEAKEGIITISHKPLTVVQLSQLC